MMLSLFLTDVPKGDTERKIKCMYLSIYQFLK